jgi:phage terminase large subunit-like protein
MGNELGEKLIALDDGQLVAALRKMREDQVRELGPNWAIWAHTGQRPPPGDWHTWLIMAGRGYGKTRAGGVSVFYKPTPQTRRNTRFFELRSR